LSRKIEDGGILLAAGTKASGADKAFTDSI
jgi:hypothetical protein